MSNFLPYERVNRCGNDGPGAANMLWWLLNESQWSDPGFNLGVYNCRLPSLHSRARAWDLGLPLVRGRANPIGDAIIARLVPVAGELGLTELIWNRRRYHRGAQWGEDYDGPSPHIDHIHGGHSLNACRLLTVPHVRTVMAGGQLPTTPRPPAPPTQPAPFVPPEGSDVQFFITDPAYGIRLVITDGTTVMDYGVTKLEQLDRTNTRIGGPMTPAAFAAFCAKYPGGRIAMGHLPG